MTIMNQAREIQQLASRFLYDECDRMYTDIGEWTEVQDRITQGIDSLTKLEGDTPEEEAEAALAILMGYAVAVRNNRNIASTLKRARKVLPKIEDKVLKCHLTVFCYGECFDAKLAEEAHRLIGELKNEGKESEVVTVEALLESYEF